MKDPSSYREEEKGRWRASETVLGRASDSGGA